MWVFQIGNSSSLKIWSFLLLYFLLFLLQFLTSMFASLFFFYRLYLSACTLDLHRVFNAICKTCKSLIPPTFFSACVFPFLFFPPTKNKKRRLASNFVVTLYSSLSINQIGGGVCMLEDFGKLLEFCVSKRKFPH